MTEEEASFPTHGQVLLAPSLKSTFAGGRWGLGIKIYRAKTVPGTKLPLTATLGNRKRSLWRRQGTEFNGLLKVTQLFGGRASIQTHVPLIPQQVLFIYRPTPISRGQNPDLSLINCKGKKKRAFHTYKVQALLFVPPALSGRGQPWWWRERVLLKGRVRLAVST